MLQQKSIGGEYVFLCAFMQDNWITVQKDGWEEGKNCPPNLGREVIVRNLHARVYRISI